MPAEDGDAYEAMGEHETAISHLKEILAIFGQLRPNHWGERARRNIVASPRFSAMMRLAASTGEFGDRIC